MKKVYEFGNSKKKDVMKVLEADPYEEKSFSRVGYKLKDGKVSGLDENKTYIYFDSSEEFFKFAKEKLGDLVEESNEETTKKIVKMITEEEEQAASGFGDIFG